MSVLASSLHSVSRDWGVIEKQTVLKHFADGLQYFQNKEFIMQVIISEKQNILKTVQGLPDNTSIEEAIANFIARDSTHCNQIQTLLKNRD